jgi:uncharacterized membrane protein YhiD involved in acid resistance
MAGVKIGLGLAVAGLFTAVLTVTAPVLLPSLAICLVTASVGAAITGVVHAVQKKRSENEINSVIEKAITSEGKITDDEYSNLEIQITNASDKKRADVIREVEVVVKVNAAAAALSGMLEELAADPKPENRVEMIQFLTEASFFKEESERQLVSSLLNGLNSNNLNESKEYLLGTLTKRML